LSFEVFEWHGDSGRKIERGFCAKCGSNLFAKLERIPNGIGIRAGTLDDPSQYAPLMDFYVSSAQPWDTLNPELRKCQRSPEG
jgi:hypothetical protein